MSGQEQPEFVTRLEEVLEAASRADLKRATGMIPRQKLNAARDYIQFGFRQMSSAIAVPADPHGYEGASAFVTEEEYNRLWRDEWKKTFGEKSAGAPPLGH